VKAYETLVDRVIVSRILRTQAHTRRRQLLRKSTCRAQANSISVLRTCNPTERYTMAYQRSDSPNFVPYPSFLSARLSIIRKLNQFSACYPRILWLALACGILPVAYVLLLFFRFLTKVLGSIYTYSRGPCGARIPTKHE
jgi:hypothetical protein